MIQIKLIQTPNDGGFFSKNKLINQIYPNFLDHFRMRAERSKRWCFTLNNPTDQEKELLATLISGENPIQGSVQLTYLVFGRERVSTDHLQGYLETSQKVTLKKLKVLVPRAHWEKAKGTSKQASDYCKKDNDFDEWGTLSVGQGARTDLIKIKEAIDDGKSEEYIADNFFSKWVVYRRSFQAYATLKRTDRHFATVTHVYWGKTGTGKTRFVMDQIMDDDYWSPGDYKWFDGYSGQKIVVLDDYRGEYPLQMLLKLLDRYPMSVPIKGGFVNWCPKKIYITSNIHPNCWYSEADPFSISAMYRRLTKIEACFEDLY